MGDRLDRPASEVYRVETAADSSLGGWLKAAAAAVMTAVFGSTTYPATFVRVVEIGSKAVLLQHKWGTPAAAEEDAAFIAEQLSSKTAREFVDGYGLDASA